MGLLSFRVARAPYGAISCIAGCGACASDIGGILLHTVFRYISGGQWPSVCGPDSEGTARGNSCCDERPSAGLRHPRRDGLAGTYYVALSVSFRPRFQPAGQSAGGMVFATSPVP